MMMTEIEDALIMSSDFLHRFDGGARREDFESAEDFEAHKEKQRRAYWIIRGLMCTLDKLEGQQLVKFCEEVDANLKVYQEYFTEEEIQAFGVAGYEQ